MQPEVAKLSDSEKAFLLRLAREAVEAAARAEPLPRFELSTLPPKLRAEGACFVTLLKGKELRGCTGVLTARMPLAQEVILTASQTALNDPRFSPVKPEEVSDMTIEISVLTPPRKLEFKSGGDLPGLLRPHLDGVTLYRGRYRATFLPQVWDKIPDPHLFLDLLSQKMGLPAKVWTEPGIEVEVYQVEEFSDYAISLGSPEG